MRDENPYRASGAFVGETYVDRTADKQLLDEIYLNKRYPYVLSSRQSGKSSLIAKTVSKLNHEEFESVFIDLTALSPSKIISFDDFIETLIEKIQRRLLKSSEIQKDRRQDSEKYDLEF